MARTNYSLLRW